MNVAVKQPLPQVAALRTLPTFKVDLHSEINVDHDTITFSLVGSGDQMLVIEADADVEWMPVYGTEKVTDLTSVSRRDVVVIDTQDMPDVEIGSSIVLTQEQYDEINEYLATR